MHVLVLVTNHCCTFSPIPYEFIYHVCFQFYSGYNLLCPQHEEYFSNFLSIFSEMERQEVFNVSNRPRYNFKKHQFVSLLDDPIGAFLQVPKNVLHAKDI